MKRDATDAVFSDLIREAYDWACAHCSREFPDRKGRDIHCSHFYSRVYHSTRWFPDNAVALCATCHDHMGKHPDDHTDFFRRVLGEVRYDWLKRRKGGIYRYRASDKKAMRKLYSEELERVRALRAQGVTGYVEVAAYD